MSVVTRPANINLHAINIDYRIIVEIAAKLKQLELNCECFVRANEFLQWIDSR